MLVQTDTELVYYALKVRDNLFAKKQSTMLVETRRSSKFVAPSLERQQFMIQKEVYREKLGISPAPVTNFFVVEQLVCNEKVVIFVEE